MRLTPCSSGTTIGAEIGDLDLSGELSDADVSAIREALFRHHVLLFRDQVLTPEAQVRFARRLGKPGAPEPSAGLVSHHGSYPEIQRLSFIRSDGRPPTDRRPSQADSWHTDYAYLPKPPALAMLAAVELPADGPDTLYLDMRAAYAALPPVRRAELERLHARHIQKGPLDPAIYQLPPYRRDGAPDDGSAERNAVHPLVRRHPVTDVPALYLAECYTVGIEGMASADGRALIAELYRHAKATGSIYRHQWQPGDCLLWDNTACNHRRSKPMDAPRVMHRVTIALDQSSRTSG
ncbi:MAG: TauD/TfdA family dioxygenase [Alphaproteobacteria bacterium]|nr:TauD/TfdA family dioxygenase [Alphaproteobacteria bacterium]